MKWRASNSSSILVRLSFSSSVAVWVTIKSIAWVEPSRAVCRHAPLMAVQHPQGSIPHHRTLSLLVRHSAENMNLHEDAPWFDHATKCYANACQRNASLPCPIISVCCHRQDATALGGRSNLLWQQSATISGGCLPLTNTDCCPTERTSKQ